MTSTSGASCGEGAAGPVTLHNFNYASVTTAVVLFGAGGWYLLSARRWFKCPRVQGTTEELAAIERELAMRS